MDHLRALHPAPGVLAFYDGRVDGYRWADGENWVDEGALELGIASYAIVDGAEALVYDTSVSVAHARRIRDELEAMGCERFTVVLSHWHLDHIAGTEAFADCEVIANERTAELMGEHRAAIEAGTKSGPPAIDPLILPTRTFTGSATVRIGSTSIELIQADIHSDDATVLWRASDRLLFAGDTMEDTVTYVTEPQKLATHRAELDRLRELGPRSILPNHGNPDVIAGGGYGPGLIDATQQYIDVMLRLRDEPELERVALDELIADSLSDGSITWFAPYEAVHRENVDIVLGRAEPL
jgi:glyoxylase-like metal-dependent hydrolase (beta-lactamase superfamily II)